MSGSICSYERIGEVLGWSLANVSQGLSDNLLVKPVTIVSNTFCFLNTDLDDFSKLCAYATEAGPGPCHGDSGGPLLLDNFQIGLLSYGDEYCNTSVPSVYTNIPYYWQWIKYIIEGNALSKSKWKPHKSHVDA